MSQTIKVLIRLRELILNGELGPGERLFEVPMADRLGASRTPIRAALARLAEEGLLEKMPGGGYVVREFTVQDIQDAVEVRGTIEGMAARFAAERGVGAIAINKINACVASIDDLLGKPNLTSEDIACYVELNELFHQQLVALAESFVVERMLGHIVALPFASANAFVIARSEMEQSWKLFLVAQEQHRDIVQAIENRQGTRAESLAREHARLSLRSLRPVLKNKSVLQRIPGSKLISEVATTLLNSA
ncbi:MAG: GntR family transcriptional regulator [Chloroflexi bacterium]|nr:GntR family transcriptional regulator [Chloroflexota bacterium]